MSTIQKDGSVLFTTAELNQMLAAGTPVPPIPPNPGIFQPWVPKAYSNSGAFDYIPFGNQGGVYVDNWGSVPGLVVSGTTPDDMKVVHGRWPSDIGYPRAYPSYTRGYIDNDNVSRQYSKTWANGRGSITTDQGCGFTLGSMTGIIAQRGCRITPSVATTQIATPTPGQDYRNNGLGDFYIGPMQLPNQADFPLQYDFQIYDVQNDQRLNSWTWYGETAAGNHPAMFTIDGIEFDVVVNGGWSGGYHNPAGAVCTFFMRPNTILKQGTNQVWGPNDGVVRNFNVMKMIQKFMVNNPKDDNGNPIVCADTGKAWGAAISPNLYFAAGNLGIECNMGSGQVFQATRAALLLNKEVTG